MNKLKHTPYKIVMVALDLTKMDDHLIDYTAMICRFLPVERLFFVHVAPDLELPAELLEKYPDLLAPIDEGIEKDIRDKVGKYFTDSKIHIDYIVKDGNPIEKILRLSRIKEVDLLVMGRKKSLDGSGIVSSRIARKCPCSLLLVTQDLKSGVKRILVPVDFSGHSFLAIEQALEISEKSNAKLLLAHIHEVPVGYTKTGKSYEEFAQITREHAEENYNRFIEKHSFSKDITCDFILRNDESHNNLIYYHAKDVDADLIVIGSKGRTRASSILIGSLAEKIVFRDNDVPILIVKNKGENMGLMDALMKV